MNKKNRISILILILCFVAIFAFGIGHVKGRTSYYIKENGKKNMKAILEQLEQNYDHQIDNYYYNLTTTETDLFQDGNRSLVLADQQEQLKRREEITGRAFLFIKDNGVVCNTDGETYRLEIPDTMLLDLKQGKKVAKLVDGGKKDLHEGGYLIAIPCEEYTVDGETYCALGTLYNPSEIDSMLEVKGYGGQAVMFLVDEEGYVSYTNQKGDAFYRNYSLLKHLNVDNALEEDQMAELQKKMSQEEMDVELLGNKKAMYYFGFTTLTSSNSKLVCIVPKSVVENALLNYQELLMRSWALVGLVTGVLLVILVFSISRMRFETQKRILQEDHMQELETEKDKANAANKSKSEFLSNMSHDIRTPMNAIVGITNLMEHDVDNHEKMIKYISKIESSSQYLLGLINDVLDMSKIESAEVDLNLEEVNLAEQVAQIDSILRPQAEERHHTFTISANEIVHESLIGDSVRLRQIMINLLSNAVKYTANGGMIHFELSELPSQDEDHSLIQITVTDNGYGMTEELVANIYEPFVRAENSTTNKIQGTGLGMAITKKIVDLMGGTITVQSELNKGSCFTVRLPLLIDKTAKYSLDAENVLLISENDSVISNMKASFKESGIVLHLSKSTEEGKQLLHKQMMDIILLDRDIHEPGLSEMVKELRSEASDIMIFCADGTHTENTLDLIKTSGVTGVVSNPFFLSKLASQVNEILYDKKTDEAENRNILKGLRFMCAEDNALNSEILNALLDMNGATCVIYPDGQELVEAFKTVKAGDYDAILMDVQMPIMNGLEATKAIRSGKNPLGKDIPIIAMTANAFSSDVQNCLNAGMDAHIPKPLNIETLERTMRVLYNRMLVGGQTKPKR